MLRLEHQSGFDFHRERFLKMLGNTKEPIAIERIMDVIRNNAVILFHDSDDREDMHGDKYSGVVPSFQRWG